MKIRSTSALQPTLWRTCRVLANRKRLQILALVVRDGTQNVSTVARQMKLSLPTVSQYLRALEARGLLTCRRVNRRVEYSLAKGGSEGSANEIVAALRLVLRRGEDHVARVFKQTTAFTHPRRIEVFRAIAKGADSFLKIQVGTRISVPALQRHLTKLEARSFISSMRGTYTARRHAEPFARVLSRLGD